MILGEQHRVSRIAVGLALVAIVSSCGIGVAEEGAGTSVPGTPVPTIAGVGSLPEPPPRDRAAIIRIPAPVGVDGDAAPLIGDLAAGNRILLIGDSILASTSPRYGGQAAHDLVDLGVVRLVLGDGEQQRRPRRKTFEDESQLVLVAHLVAAVVAPEEHDRRVPVVGGGRVVVEQAVEHAVAEVDEPAGLGFDGDLPAERYELVAHLAAVAR
jgi:hypothetical protein